MLRQESAARPGGWLQREMLCYPDTLPALYAVTMADETPDSYPVSMRALALLGLFLVGAVAFILLDVASNGKLTGCADCDKESAGA